jgi:hypothetical protein
MGDTPHGLKRQRMRRPPGLTSPEGGAGSISAQAACPVRAHRYGDFYRIFADLKISTERLTVTL